MLTKSVSRRLAHQPPEEPMFGTGLPLDGYDMIVGDVLEHLSEQHIGALMAACDVFSRFSRGARPNGLQRSNVGFVRVHWALNAMSKVIGNAHITTDGAREALDRIVQARDILKRELERKFPPKEVAA